MAELVMEDIERREVEAIEVIEEIARGGRDTKSKTMFMFLWAMPQHVSPSYIFGMNTYTNTTYGTDSVNSCHRSRPGGPSASCVVCTIKEEVEALPPSKLYVASQRRPTRCCQASDKALPFRGKEVRRPIPLCLEGKSAGEGSSPRRGGEA
jgi:hypothetical protein